MVLTKVFVAALQPVLLHFTVQLLFGCFFLFKLRVFALLLETRLLKRLFAAKGIVGSLVSERLQVNDLSTTSLLRFTCLSVLLSAVLFKATLWSERSTR